MFDLMDQFSLFLMNEFHKSLGNDLERWTKNLVTAVNENNSKNIDTAIKYIKNYRELMNDLSDENMEIKDFVGLIAEKYGFVRADKE